MRLALFFTEGVSLKTWSQVGMLERELALYKKLQHRGVQVEFVTYGDRSDLSFADKMPGIGLHANIFQLPTWLYQRSLQTRPPQAEVFKSNQVSGADVAMDASRQGKAKFIARCGYLLSEFQGQKYGFDSPEARDARHLENKIFSRANAVVVTTEVMAQIVRTNYSIPRETIRVIPNYVEVDRFFPQKQQLRNRPRVLFVGRLDKQKNLLAFVRAVFPLDVEVWLVGYGPQRDQLANETKGSIATFKFFGNMPSGNLPRVMNDCDIFVLPSLYEGHPKAMLEAMACGLPVIGTRVPGTKELIRDGETGLLCETDLDSLRAVVERLVGDAQLRQQLGDRARTFVVHNFALDRIAELELRLLSQVI